MNQLPLMLIMVFAAALGAIGQFFLKRGADALPNIMTNWWLLGFACSYGIAVIIQLGVYKLGGKVSLVYPVISLSYIFSAFIAWKYLGESIGGWTLAGTLIIVLGVAFIGIGAA